MTTIAPSIIEITAVIINMLRTLNRHSRRQIATIASTVPIASHETKQQFEHLCKCWHTNNPDGIESFSPGLPELVKATLGSGVHGVVLL